MLLSTKKDGFCKVFRPFFCNFAALYNYNMYKNIHFRPLLPTLLTGVWCLASACSGQAGQNREQTTMTPAPASVPQATKEPVRFSADSAFLYVAQQLDFGPRVPGSQAQETAAAWLKAELSRHGAQVYEQRCEVTAYNGKRLPAINLVGSFCPDAKERVLLISHWDSRHVSDQDPDPKKRTQPVPAANDGASGVGVLLELARLAGLQQPRMGIDIFLTDAEDYGPDDEWSGQHKESHWGLGTQQWCRHPHVAGYTARYGILLDMVGAPDATFYREYFSQRYAGQYVDLVWSTAAQLGYSDLFIDQRGGGVTDDHTFVNNILGIPTLDIIDTRRDSDGTFYPYWHTTDDTLDKISAETLGKVGDVLVKLLW